MSALDPITLGILLIGLGLIIGLLTLAVLRVAPRLQPLMRAAPRKKVSPDLPIHNEATLLVQSGGRVTYLNEAARRWFDLWEDEPNLEYFARRVRPAESFLSLCSGEGEARLSVDGRLIEATSYFIPFNGSQAVLVSMRRPQPIEEQGEGGHQAAGQTLGVFTELGRQMAASLDMEKTLLAVLSGVDRLIPADFLEITVWDRDRRELVPYRLKNSGGYEHTLEISEIRYTPEEGYFGYLIQQREPLNIGDLDEFRSRRPGIHRHHFPYKSYMGVPLVVAGDLIGTLELASQVKEAFHENDFELLRILAGQAAVALHNALLYEAEQRRALELAGLANLAQAVRSVSAPKDLYEQLTRSLLPLLDVEVLGFLVYERESHTLRGQVPFVGIPEDIVAWYRLVIQPGSEAERLWQSQEVLVSSHATEDERLQALELHHLAQIAGIRYAVLAPMSSGGRSLGFLLVGDKKDGQPFGEDDLRLLAIIAGQVGPIIENSILIEQSRRRARRAETLRRIASLIGSTATLDEILKYSIVDLARLMQVDYAGIYLVDENRGELRVHKESLFGVDPADYFQIGRISIDDPLFARTVTGSLRPYTNGNVRAEQVLPLYRPILKTLDVHSVMVVPVSIRERGVGEIMLGSRRPNYFKHSDLQTVSTVAGQIAAAVERAMLYSQTDQSLRQRVEQMTALTRISRELNSTVDLEHLLKRVYEEALSATQADCGTILLMDLNGHSEDAESVPTQVALTVGDGASKGLQPLEQMVLTYGEPLVVEDFRHPERLVYPAAVQEKNGVQPAHDGVRSAMIVPISFQDRVAGLIHLHSLTPQRFDESARQIGEALAVQAAVALGNAHRYQELSRSSEQLNRRLDTLSRLFETTRVLQSDQTLEEALGVLAQAIRAATPFEVVLISVFHPDQQVLQREAGAGIPEKMMAELKARQTPWGSVKKLMQPDFRVGRSYFIPNERKPVMPVDIHVVTLPELYSEPREDAHWHPEDMLFMPLFGASGDPLGLVSVDAPRNNLRPDRAAVETLEVFGSQAALVIETQQKLSSLSGRLGELETELDQARHTATTAQSELRALDEKNREQSQALEHLNQRARRIRGGLGITEMVNRQLTREDALRVLAEEMLARLELDIVLIAEMGAVAPRMVQALGDIPADVKPEALLGQRNPLRQCLQDGEALLVTSLEADQNWRGSPLLQALNAGGFICLPVKIQERSDVAILGISRSPIGEFAPEDEQLFALLAKQVGITLQNLDLMEQANRRLREVNLLMEFGRQLGSLDPADILQALVDSALRVVPQAKSAMVLIWDPIKKRLVPQAAVGYTRTERVMEMVYEAAEGVIGDVFTSGNAVRLPEVDAARHYNLSSENLMSYRDATGGSLPVSSMAVPIVGATQPAPLGVLVLENFSIPEAFSAEEQALITTLAQQTALTLENAQLYQASRQRAGQLQALTEVATTITSSLQPEELVATLLDQLEAILPYDTGTLWLHREGQGEEQTLVIGAARGFTDSEERLGLEVSVADSQLITEMVKTGQPIFVPDVRADARFPSLANHERLSWLGIPLLASGQVIGVIALEKTEPSFYTADHLQAARTFAGQAAVGLENANLYQESLQRARELDERSHRLAILNRLSTELSSSLDAGHMLDAVLRELSLIVNASSVSVILYDAPGLAMLEAEYPANDGQLPARLPETPLFNRLRQSLGAFSTTDVTREVELEPLADFLGRRRTRSLLALPMAIGEELRGLLLVHHEQAYHFNSEEVELVRTIANQTAIGLQNARLFAETRSLTEELEQRVEERTAELAREHHRIELLLRIITELSASLDLDQVLNRTLQILNEIVDAEQITVLIVREGDRHLHRIASVGYTNPPGRDGEVTSLGIDQGLAGWVIKNRQAALIENVLEDSRWLHDEDRLTEHRSVMAVPLMIGAEALGTLLLFHRSVAHFSSEHLDLVQAAANQVAVAVNNAELYRLIRDQAEGLGNMLRNQQIETSRSKAILEAVADGVLVTDASRRITLFNASAEQILGLDRTEVVGKSLEYFTGLFGRAAQAWMETIRTWSEDPTTHHAGDTYAEQIMLETGRVVSVHLAPVSMGSDFLGTVSIFQDVTHQVEVDRLKSEFVATVSHELRTPMTSIKGYVEVLLMGAAGPLSEQQTHFLDVVKTNTERLAVLVNDLLDISRLETGKVTLTRQPVILTELVDDAMADLTRRAETENKTVKFVKDFPDDLPRVYGDVDRVRQVLSNLLENGYHYNSEAEVRLAIRARLVGEEVQIDVRDNGVGILPADQERVFERFFRGESPLVLGVSGTGLGLSIVQSLVQMHGGRIWVESEGKPGKGSTFSFTLPIYTPAK